MTDSDGSTTSGKPGGQSNKPVSPARSGSVFKGGTGSEAKQPTEHPGVHGEDGRENDLDRAEDAGREGGQR